ncbi:MAG TPA: hypothetical protein VGN72_18455 [Tepidisphaeraceae bacterium]|jgi:hypothetical protein|nr:hypothetical protein [Tepidisphaeraceae bacterium]
MSRRQDRKAILRGKLIPAHSGRNVEFPPLDPPYVSLAYLEDRTARLLTLDGSRFEQGAILDNTFRVFASLADARDYAISFMNDVPLPFESRLIEKDIFCAIFDHQGNLIEEVHRPESR